uniref:Uncharacterized protein n=1 Tax=Rhizophora mucronata TaxID=61149 RepID=A0A2P2R465_RHIMU
MTLKLLPVIEIC